MSHAAAPSHETADSSASPSNLSIINCLKGFPSLSLTRGLRNGRTSAGVHLIRPLLARNLIFITLPLLMAVILDWYSQKEVRPWYLPLVNSFLSPIDKTSWSLTPNDTNIVETAHVARNRDTKTNLPLWWQY